MEIGARLGCIDEAKPHRYYPFELLVLLLVRPGYRCGGLRVPSFFVCHRRTLSTGEFSIPLLLDKILTLLFLPLGIGLGAGLLALAAFAFNRRRTAAGLLAFALVWLWLWSTPLVSKAIVDSLCDQYPIQRVEGLPAEDAIVLLDGGTQPISKYRVYPGLGSTSDRVWHAARLYHAGKSPLIVASGGNVWNRPDMQSGADAMRTLLEALGVPNTAILVEESSRTTHENAVFTAKLAAERGIKRVLLVTDAWHMPRAEATFRRVGLEVVPAPLDYTRGRVMPWTLAILPHVWSLKSSSLALKEYLGFLVYRLRGWA